MNIKARRKRLFVQGNLIILCDVKHSTAKLFFPQIEINDGVEEKRAQDSTELSIVLIKLRLQPLPLPTNP